MAKTYATALPGDAVIPHEVLELHRFPGEDHSRPALMQLAIEACPERNELVAIATNGHYLAAYYWRDNTSPLWDGLDKRGGSARAVMLAAEPLADVAKAVRKAKLTSAIASSYSLNVLNVSYKMTLRSDLEYPDWRQVVQPLYDSPTATPKIGLDLGYVDLARAWIKQCRPSKSKTNCATLHMPSDPLAPMLFRSENEDGRFDFWLMPVRI